MSQTITCKYLITLFIGILLLSTINSSARAKNLTKEPVIHLAHKVLIVISSDKHGYWLPEVTEPYRILEDAGYHIDIASPLGDVGRASGRSRLSTSDSRWLPQSSLAEKLDQPIALQDIHPTQYQAIYFAGGAGPMFDLVDNQESHRIVREIYENGGLVSADCHGPVALLNVKLSNGNRLISGKKLTAKANIEEGRWAHNNYPFLLEDKISALGGQYFAGPKGEKHVVIDGRLITGQNPNSALPMAKVLVKQLQSRKAIISDKNSKSD